MWVGSREDPTSSENNDDTSQLFFQQSRGNFQARGGEELHNCPQKRAHTAFCFRPTGPRPRETHPWVQVVWGFALSRRSFRHVGHWEAAGEAGGGFLWNRLAQQTLLCPEDVGVMVGGSGAGGDSPAAIDGLLEVPTFWCEGVPRYRTRMDTRTTHVMAAVTPAPVTASVSSVLGAGAHVRVRLTPKLVTAALSSYRMCRTRCCQGGPLPFLLSSRKRF